MSEIRTFDTGATRDANKAMVPTGFNSPLVELCFARYMAKHRLQKDGKLRAADNWKKGIPRQAYLESMGRHFLELWLRMEYPDAPAEGDATVYPDEMPSIEDTLCALRFNVNGLLHEIIVGRDAGRAA